MEQNKVRNFIRAILFMIKKNISKPKLLLDLNLIMKRGKLAGKALHNLMLHHHHRRSPDNFTFPPPPPTEDYHEFSCSNTPVYPLSLFTTRKKHHNHKNSTQLQKKLKPAVVKDESYDEIFVDPAVIKMLEMLTSATASPAVPGFGKSPMAVTQLRVTDSPYPLTNVDEDSHVDEAAEKFIMKFYNDLRRQN